MTTQLLLALVLLQAQWCLSDAWCFYFCPKDKWPETFCAVDSVRGARLFQGRCQIWRANYCLTAEYREMDMRQCLDRYPGVLVDYLTSTKSLQRFDQTKGSPSVGMWRRFFLLWSILSRMAPKVYSVPPAAILLPLLQWLLGSKESLSNPNNLFAGSAFPQDDLFSYPGSPRVSPFASRLNPFAFTGLPYFNPFSHPEPPLY